MGSVSIRDKFDQPKIFLGDRGGIKSVRFNDIRASSKVLPVDLLDNFRPGERKNVVIVLQEGGMARELITPIILFLEFVLLDHGSHGSVQDHDPLVESFHDIKRSGFLQVFGHRRWNQEFSIGPQRPQTID